MRYMRVLFATATTTAYYPRRHHAADSMKKLVFGIAILCASITGCIATTGGLKGEPLDAGTSQTYGVPLNRVVAATREAVMEAGFQIDDVSHPSDSTWVVIGKRGAGFFSYGELVRAVIQPAGKGQTAVRVLTKRRVATDITAKGDYSHAILSNVASIVQTQTFQP